MARGRRGRPLDGWLIVDKPAGVTSSAVVNKVKWALEAQKAGHAGTLDPAATGVLAVALGEATKTVPYVTDALKAYRFTVRWGQETDSDDADGVVVATHPSRPDRAAIEAALPGFTGRIMQAPPAVSAVKIDGQRAYALARAGQAPAPEARPIHVDSLDLIDMPDADHAIFEMVCGKGGYVRAFARDIGRTLGCLGHVSSLRRIWSGPFEPEDGVDWETLEMLARTPELEARLLPVAAGLHDVAETRCRPEAAARLARGNPAEVVPVDPVGFGEPAWASLDGRPVAVGTYQGGKLHPSRVFNLTEAAAGQAGA